MLAYAAAAAAAADDDDDDVTINRSIHEAQKHQTAN
jgi:hypothetical protein